MRKALVTGGCGFVGRHLVRRLIDTGFHVTIVDNFYPGSGCLEMNRWPATLRIESKLSAFTLHNADCRVFFKEDDSYYDEVFHLAAVVGGRMVIEKEPLAVGTDLAIDAEFFYWLSRLSRKPGKVHYFSSTAAYPIIFQGVNYHRELSENDIDLDGGQIGRPDLTYGWSKLTGEYLAKIYFSIYSSPIVCYRPFSGYGEDQDLTYPFPSIVKRCIETHEEQAVLVWGSGMQSRDFVHIEDCVDLICNFSEKITDGSAVNISTGVGTNFNQLAKKVLTMLNKRNEVVNSSDKPEGVFYRVGSVDLQHKLGFVKRTELEVGLQKAIDFFKAG